MYIPFDFYFSHFFVCFLPFSGVLNGSLRSRVSFFAYLSLCKDFIIIILPNMIYVIYVCMYGLSHRCDGSRSRANPRISTGVPAQWIFKIGRMGETQPILSSVDPWTSKSTITINYDAANYWKVNRRSRIALSQKLSKAWAFLQCCGGEKTPKKQTMILDSF